MPDAWYPGAWRLAGQNAGYRAGRITDLWGAVCHFTVGRNSTGTCGRDFQLLTSRDGTVWQGAEIDAVNWGAGDPWNRHCVHIEVEYLPGVDDELWTPEQEAATGALCDWLRSEWGVPGAFYDGPRIPEWRGFITHRSLIQTGDLHSDWWPHLPTAVQPAPVPAPAAPTFALTGDTVMGFAVNVLPASGLYEVFSIDDQGQVIQWYYPRTTADEHAVVATGADPLGDVRAVRQANGNQSGRCDVWYDLPDGTRGHAFQHGSGDWVWNVDQLAW